MALSRSPSLFRFSCFLAVAFGSTAAHATAYSVSPTGSDSASGLATAPWLTIQRAFDNVKPGDSVTVEDGTYAGLACDTVSGTASAPIVFRSRNKWGAKITSANGDSPQDFVQFSSCSYITFDGFEVSGAPRSGIAILGNADDGSDARGVVIQNCNSHNNGGTTVAGRHDGIFSGFALDLTIQDNVIDTCGEHGIYVSNAADNPSILRNKVSNTGANCIQINADVSTGGDGLISNWRIEGNVVQTCQGAAGINLDGAIHGVARNNVIYNAAGGGFTLFQGDGAEASHDNLIVNNTVYNPNGSRSAIQVAAGANNNVLFNNIFIANADATGIEIQAVTGLMHDYNIVSDYDGGSAAAHESTLSVANAAALFVDASHGNLQLAAGSAAIDKGVASYGSASAPTTDVLGGGRPAGAAYDVGAYEYGATPPVTGQGGAAGGSVGAGGSLGSGGSGGNSGGNGGSAGGSGGAGGGAGRSATGGTGGSVGNTGGAGGSAATGGRGGSTGGSGGHAGNTGGTGGSVAGTGGSTTAGSGGRANATGGSAGGVGGAGAPQTGDSSGCSCNAAGDATPGRLALEIVLASFAFVMLTSRRRRSKAAPGR